MDVGNGICNCIKVYLRGMSSFKWFGCCLGSLYEIKLGRSNVRSLNKATRLITLMDFKIDISPAAGGSGRSRSPPPHRPAVSPLPPAPPPPSAAAAAATVTSALARPSLPHCAAAEGRKARPLSGEGAGCRGRSRPTP